MATKKTETKPKAPKKGKGVKEEPKSWVENLKNIFSKSK